MKKASRGGEEEPVSLSAQAGGASRCQFWKSTRIAVVGHAFLRRDSLGLARHLDYTSTSCKISQLGIYFND